MAKTNKKIALVLSGGGMHGAFQVGALKALRDNWGDINTKWKGIKPDAPMKFDIVAGVSAGALNGVLTAADRLDDLDQLWTDVGNNKEVIYTSDFIDTKDQGDTIKVKVDFEVLLKKFLPNFNINLWNIIRLAFKGQRKKVIEELRTNFNDFKSIADNSPLKKTLSVNAKVTRSMIPDDVRYYCGYVSLDTGEYVSLCSTDFNTDEDFINGIVASTSIPVVWAPSGVINTFSRVPATEKNCIDGGIRNSSPLGDVISLIDDENKSSGSNSEYLIIVINNHNGRMSEENYDKKNIAQIALRSVFDIALSEIFMNDLSQFMDTNSILKQVPPGTKITISGRELKVFESIIIQPLDSAVMGDALASNPKLIQRRKDYGAEIAHREIKKFQVGKSHEDVEPT